MRKRILKKSQTLRMVSEKIVKAEDNSNVKMFQVHLPFRI